MKKFLSSMINTLPKRIAASLALAMALVLPVATSANTAVAIESSLGVANITKGETKYSPATSASYDQEVMLQVYYHNKEMPDSGKIAKNINVKITMPTKAGKTQVVKSTVKGDNTNTVSDTVTVNLDRADATLDYIPGSANWRHNTGTNANPKIVDTKISDDVVLKGTGVTLEDEKPCYNFSATVTIKARVHIPGVKIVKQSEVKGETNKWSNNNTAKPGDTLKYMITYQNIGNTKANNVIIRDSLPVKMTLVPGTTTLINSSNPNGVKINSDNITNGGIVIGNYLPGGGAYVTFEVKVPAESALACGTTEFRNVGVAKPENVSEYYNTAITKVTKTCEETPKTPTCDLVTVNKLGGREIEAKVDYTANGATLKTVTYDFGDGSTPLTTDKTSAKYTYAADGDYNVTVDLLFSVDGKDKTVSSDSCAKPVSFTTPSTPETPETPVTPEELPKTGAGNVLVLFAIASVASAVAHRLFLARRLARES